MLNWMIVGCFFIEEELIQRRREELRHASEVRELYEHKLRRANNLCSELNSCMMQLEQREREILQKEQQIVQVLTSYGMPPRKTRPKQKIMRPITVRAGSAYLKGVSPRNENQGVQCGWPVSLRGCREEPLK